MTFGFALRQLTLAGPGVKSAEVTFKRGLNVITGPSDTGKTFIGQCIDWALGAGTAPNAIPEAKSYATVLLDIESRQESRVFRLERALEGGDIRLSMKGEADRILGAKHQADSTDTVSAFLLELSGLAGKKVRLNQHGKTRPLSFRDLARLIIVDEESVISATSPILSGQYTLRTVESRVFHLLLTGKDDSSIIAREDPKHARGRRAGKQEILQTLLERTRAQLTELQVSGTLGEIRDQLVALDATLEAATAELAKEQASAGTVEGRRRAAWTDLRKAESRVDVLKELHKRFLLLQKQYTSDLHRLDAIAEAGVRLGQMKEERCPVCGALAEYHDVQHQRNQAAPPDVVQACKAEAQKTITLLRDLENTLASNATEIERLQAEVDQRQTELESISAELKNLLQPRLQAAVQRVRDAQARRAARRRDLELLERMQELEGLLNEAATPVSSPRADGPPATVSSGEAEPFSKEVEALLRSWHFPNLDRVTFSEDDQDIVISGRPRASHGKGVRAITRAAFNLALLRLCARRPFPAVVLIDSPLVVYREPDPEEGEFPPEVKNAFYEGVAAGFAREQVIILENDQPPESVLRKANVIAFTGTRQGRRGFIPMA